MKTTRKIYSCLAGAVLLTSCTAEAPFQMENEGVVRLNLTMSTKTTRADDPAADYTPESLLRNASIVLARNADKGNSALYLWNKENPAPASVNLHYGSYTADVWTGDSLPASFTAKYFRVTHPFEVNSPTTQVNVVCPIANTVVSVDGSSIDNSYVTDVRVTVANGNGNGELEFDDSNFNAKGYYMLSTDPATHYLEYTVTAKNLSGQEFTKTGKIENALRSHEYRLKFEYHPGESTSGGAFVQIKVDDSEIEDFEEIEMLGVPQMSWFNGRDVRKQVVGEKGAFASEMLRVACWGTFRKLELTTEDATLTASLGTDVIDFLNVQQAQIDALAQKGLRFNKAEHPDPGQEKYFIYLTDWLNNLPESNEELVFTMVATDSYGKSCTSRISIANTEAAIIYEDPILMNEEFTGRGLAAMDGNTVTIPVMVENADAVNPTLLYREQGGEEWHQQPIALTRAASATVTLTGLTAGKTYEYKLAWGENLEKESDVYTFRAEEKFVIPNASMEDWSQDEEKNVLIPNADGKRTFWDTGNHGSATMSKTITNPSEAFHHIGTKCAELKSQFVGIGAIGKFAAGNIFVGQYVETVGTDGRISFGREYNGSHPTALTVWANYRPGLGVSKKGADDKYIAAGAKDKAQIYVALTTKPIEVFTKDKSTLFNPDAPEVLAYGQATLDDDFGADGILEQLNIPIVYKGAPKNTSATHLVIVCSASKYGDYFSGGEGSLLYLDDFELVY